MPRVIVNTFSIVVGRVIQFLSTLELTVQRHFCSILKHPHSPALWLARQRRHRVDREKCARLRA